MAESPFIKPLRLANSDGELVDGFFALKLPPELVATAYPTGTVGTNGQITGYVGLSFSLAGATSPTAFGDGVIAPWFSTTTSTDSLAGRAAVGVLRLPSTPGMVISWRDGAVASRDKYAFKIASGGIEIGSSDLHGPKSIVVRTWNGASIGLYGEGSGSSGTMTATAQQGITLSVGSASLPGAAVATILGGSDVATAQGIAVVDVTNSGGKFEVEVDGAHGRIAGDYVYLHDIGGTPNANGFWQIESPSANTFVLTGSTFAGAYTAGGFFEYPAAIYTFPAPDDHITMALVMVTARDTEDEFAHIYRITQRVAGGVAAAAVLEDVGSAYDALGLIGTRDPLAVLWVDDAAIVYGLGDNTTALTWTAVAWGK